MSFTLFTRSSLATSDLVTSYNTHTLIMFPTNLSCPKSSTLEDFRTTFYHYFIIYPMRVLPSDPSNIITVISRITSFMTYFVLTLYGRSIFCVLILTILYGKPMNKALESRKQEKHAIHVVSKIRRTITEEVIQVGGMKVAVHDQQPS